jgi:hypothetical protein
MKLRMLSADSMLMTRMDSRQQGAKGDIPDG